MDSKEMAETIKRLRDYTGEGIMACRKALEIHNYDYEDALEHIRICGNLVARPSGSLLSCGCRTK